MPRGKAKKKKVVETEAVEPVETVDEPDSEVLSESEADAMIERKEKEVKKKEDSVLLTVDSQDWTRMDPVIPEALKGRVWIAVYACPKDHKTKATNRQKESGIWCWQCREEGKEVKATIMPKLFDNPPEDPNAADEKRRKRMHS